MGIIRFLLALSVVLYHLRFTMGDNVVPLVNFGVRGAEAVQVFFIISGFYMALVLNGKYGAGFKSYWLFISNRYLRLYPTYIATVLLSLGLCLVMRIAKTTPFGTYWSWLYSWSYAPYRPPVWEKIVLAFSNLFIVGQDWTFYFGITKGTGHLAWMWNYSAMPGAIISARDYMLTPQAWTLSTELTFYVLAPFLVRKKSLWISTLIVCSLVLRIWLTGIFGEKNLNFYYRFFPTELAFFAAGALAYKLYVKLKPASLSTITGAGLLILMTGFILICPIFGQRFYFFTAFTLALPFIFNVTRENKWDRLIGELSYPLYMIHWFMLTVCKALFSLPKIHLQGVPLLVVTVSSCVIASILIVLVIELPMEKWRASRFKKATQPPQEPPLDHVAATVTGPQKNL